MPSRCSSRTPDARPRRTCPWEGGQLIPLADGGWTPVAPSAIAARRRTSRRRPRSTPQGLAAIRDAFVASARRAERAGIDALELHMAHGYLLHEFLSPIANRRTDAYGGIVRQPHPLPARSVRRRARRMARRAAARRAPVVHRLGRRRLDARRHRSNSRGALVARGCDWIDASSGGVSPAQKIPLAPGYQVQLRARDPARDRRRTMAVGLITDARAGAGDRRGRRRRHGRDGARVSVGSALGVARRGRARRDYRAAAAIFARRAARCGRRVSRREDRAALTAWRPMPGSARLDAV